MEASLWNTPAGGATVKEDEDGQDKMMYYPAQSSS
jgi:hypothetical protein